MSQYTPQFILFTYKFPTICSVAPADEGIYGWILSLIEEGKVARIVDRRRGIYELDWKIVVPRYWFEFREARKRLKSKSVKEIKFDHRNASNTLRASLLNAYKGKGKIAK